MIKVLAGAGMAGSAYGFFSSLWQMRALKQIQWKDEPFMQICAERTKIEKCFNASIKELSLVTWPDVTALLPTPVDVPAWKSIKKLDEHHNWRDVYASYQNHQRVAYLSAAGFSLSLLCFLSQSRVSYHAGQAAHLAGRFVCLNLDLLNHSVAYMQKFACK